MGDAKRAGYLFAPNHNVNYTSLSVSSVQALRCISSLSDQIAGVNDFTFIPQLLVVSCG